VGLVEKPGSNGRNGSERQLTKNRFPSLKIICEPSVPYRVWPYDIGRPLHGVAGTSLASFDYWQVFTVPAAADGEDAMGRAG
jgi:hypothetical protein